MVEAEELKALAQRCRELAAASGDDETRTALEGLAAHYDAQAAAVEAEAETPAPRMPLPPE